MAISLRSSVLAVKVETAEGTPAAPAGATDYVAIQENFVMMPGFNVLANAELTPSIGKRQSILGSQKPTASGDHYVRHSGVEGQAPDYSPLLKACIGTQTVAGTEYPLVSASTVSQLKFNTGIGANFARGQGVLVKDGTNGYAIRVIDSIATDSANLSFNLAGAPASGVKTGKCVFFSPAQVGHPTLTFWHYVGNGGAVQMMTGVRPTKFDIKAQAGGLINASMSFDGIAFYLDPVTITSSTKYLDFTDDTNTFAVTVAAGTYQDPSDLAEALQTAMNGSGTSQTYTVTYDSATGHYSIVGTGTLLSLLFNTGTNAANSIAAKIGFSGAADSTGSSATVGYTSASAPTLASPYTPSLDSATPLAAKSNEVFVGNGTDTVTFKASDITVSYTNTRTELKDVNAASGVSGSQFTSREVKIQLKALLQQYDTSKFTKFRENTSCRFQWNFGSKAGGQWVPGQCGYVYIPTGSITSWKVSNDNGLAMLEAEITAFVDSSGSGEYYLGFL